MSYGYAEHIDASPSVPDAPPHSDRVRAGQLYSTVTLEGNASAHFGDVYHQYQSEPLVWGTHAVYVLHSIEKGDEDQELSEN